MLNFKSGFLTCLLIGAVFAPLRVTNAQSSAPLGSLTSGDVSAGGSATEHLVAPNDSTGEARIEAIDPVYDFGSVYSGTIIKHTYRLKNTGTAPLSINGVRTSCGCTAAKPTQSRLLPGEESDIAVTFDTGAEHGQATRTITVFTNDPRHPELQLTLRGDVKVQVEAMPPLVVFGRVKRGTEQSRQVMLTDQMPDRSFTVSGITKTSPYVRVTSKTVQSRKPAVLLTVTLLRTAPAGPVNDVVKVSTSRAPVEIPVSGTVLGDINVNPPQVSFGIVPHHASALRYLRLMNSGGRPIRVTGISSNNPSVRAAVEPIKAGREYKISVQLAPNTPDGVLRGMLAIKTDDPHQQDLQVPFYGIVGSFKG
jgi:hypothetical protein